MKKIFALFGLLAGLNAHAQFFEFSYGSPTTIPQELGGGLSIRVNGTGQFLSGRSTLSPNILQLVRADLFGFSTVPPGFNNLYTVRNNVNNPMTIRSSKVEEVPGSFVVAGNCLNNTTQQNGIYFVNVLAGAGAPFAAMFYFVPNVTLRLGNIYAQGAGSTDVYLTGTADYGGGTTDFFVMKVNASGVTSWAYRYNFTLGAASLNESGNDLTLTASGNDLAVVGSAASPGSATNGFFALINATTGLPPGASQGQLWGTAASADEFRSIALTSGGNYLVCGTTTNTTAGEPDMWALELTGIGAGATWNKRYQYSGLIANPNNDGSDGVENPGTTNYYFIGTASGGIFGAKDLYLIHTDNMGKVVPNGQYTYGGPADDIGTAIDKSPNGISGEIDMFGTTNSFVSADRLYSLKADQNGIISPSCNTDYRNPVTNNGPGYISSTTTFGTVSTLSEVNAFCIQEGVGEENFICVPTLQTKLKGMDLEKQGNMAQEQPVVVSPNPVEPGTLNVQLNVTAAAGQVEVIIADYMGRVYVNQHFDIRDGGAQTLSVELAKANLAPGLYLLRVNGLDKPATQVLIVK